MPDAPSPIPGPRQQPPARLASSRWQRLAALYRRLPVQRGIVALVLAAAIGLQYRLVNVPVADLSQTTKFSPATIKAADQVVSFRNPETDPGSFAFAYEQISESLKQRMVVDAYFDNAVLAEDTIRKLASIKVQAPSQPAAISYLTSMSGNGTCDTSVHVDTVRTNTNDYFVQFAQSELAPSDRHRLLEMKLTGLDSEVTLSSQGTFGGNDLSTCQVTLRVGEWQQLTGGFFPITVKVPAGSGYRLRWEAADVQPTGWNTGGPALPLLVFGHSRRQSFHSDEVEVVSGEPFAKAGAREGLVAESEHKDNPLTVASFLIGTDHMQLTASGKGRVLENGSPITTTNLLETINKYPLIAALFGAANLGLINWAKRRFFPPSRPAAAPVVAFPKEEPAEQDADSPSQAAG